MRAVPPGRSAGGGSGAQGREVYPLSGATDLLGRMPVRVRAENRELVAYGFGDQRIAIPADTIGEVCVHRGWGKQWGRSGPALVVLDKAGRVLLRAQGTWGPAAVQAVAVRAAQSSRSSRAGRSASTYTGNFSGLSQVCDSLGIGRPKFLTLREVRQQKALWQRAPGYRKLRIRSRGYVFTRLAVVLLALLAGGLGLFLGGALASLLPPGAGDVRQLTGVLLCAAALWGTCWLYGFTLRLLNWLAVSVHARTLAPPDRFFGAACRRRNRKARAWLTAAMVAAVPMLIIWGPIVGLISLTHGFADQSLVASLRQGGVTARGLVIDMQTYSTDNDGNTVVTDHPTLSFHTPGGVWVRTPDPAIGGWTWPMDPLQPVTIVYKPADPATAAVAGQISGSPWHGAPTGNVVSGAVLTLALAPLTWLTVRRIRDARRESGEGFFEGIG